MDLSRIPLIDAHCHAPDLAGRAPSLEALRSILSESRCEEQRRRHLPHSPSAQASLALLAGLYGCGATLEEVSGALEGRDIAGRCRDLAEKAGVISLLFDHRFPPDAPGLGELPEAFGRPAYGALRIESLAEDLLPEGSAFEGFLARFLDGLAAYKARGGVALKSIIAYRSGLDVGRPTRLEAIGAYESLRKGAGAGQAGRLRIAEKNLLDFLLWEALHAARELTLPFQLHTGFGDADIHLPLANPALLRPIFEEEGLRELPIVLLHAGYPHVREAGFLVATYGNAFVDISLATPLLGGHLPRVLEELFALAPFSKVLYGSDGHTLPEMHWLGAVWARRGFERLLGSYVERGELTEAQAEEGAERVFWKNASELYGVPGPGDGRAPGN
ncbi:MAG: amidohydrolase family protein [Nitrospinota bacterium]